MTNDEPPTIDQSPPTAPPEASPYRDALVVTFADRPHQVPPGERLSFGRSADLVIDEANRHLHRWLGTFRHDDGTWILDNHGRSITLVITDASGASFARVAPGSSLPIPFPTSIVTFSAGRANYRLDVEVPALVGLSPAGGRPGEPATSESAAGIESTPLTLTTDDLEFNAEQRELLAALARPRFDGPVTSADLPTRRELAAELGWTPAKLTRKLDHLCAKFDRAGVPGLVGSVAGSADERRLRLADLVVEHGLVTRPPARR